jgi:hypothetical protein
VLTLKNITSKVGLPVPLVLLPATPSDPSLATSTRPVHLTRPTTPTAAAPLRRLPSSRRTASVRFDSQHTADRLEKSRALGRPGELDMDTNGTNELGECLSRCWSEG